MTHLRLPGLLATITLLVAAWLAPAAPARAVVFHGSFDPAYGSPFPSLGWRGEGLFDIPAPCLALSGWVNNANPCSANGMKMLSGSLSFYDVGNPTQDLETFTLNPNVFVYQMYVDGGSLKGINTNFLDPVVPTLPAAKAIAGGGNAFFHLKFLKEVSPDNTPSVALYHTVGQQDPLCLFVAPYCEGGVGQEKALLVMTSVPEPSAAALLALGLGCLLLRSRRRS